MTDPLRLPWSWMNGPAIENMLLAIVALGYASVWVEGYVLDQEAYGKAVLGIPKLRLDHGAG